MKQTKTYTYRQVRQSYSPQLAANEWRGSWSIALLYRQPGFMTAWLALRLGLSATLVTASSLCITLAIPAVALFAPAGAAALSVFVLAVIFQVLDCADGTMARTSGQASEKGGKFDFLVDMLHWGALYWAVGVLADRQFDTGWYWAALGLLAAWLRLFARVANDSAPQSPSDTQPKQPPLHVIVIAGISGVIPFLTLTGPFLHWAVLALLVYSILDVFDAVGGAFK